jgi:hypothetical protein
MRTKGNDLLNTVTKALLFLCATLVVHLCDPALAESGPNEKTVKARFRLYVSDEPISDLYYGASDKDKSVAVDRECRSMFYDYSGPTAITFYRLKTNSHGTIVKEPAAQADLENAGTWPLIVLSKDQENTGRYKTIVLKDDLASFPPGTYAFSNFTSSVIEGLLGASLLKLAPGENTLIPGNREKGGTTIAASFSIITDSGKPPLYTNNWAITPATRTRVFFMSSPETPSGVVVRRLVESTIFPEESPTKPQKVNRPQ